MRTRRVNYLSLVSEITGVSIRDILSKSRKAKIVQSRQICQYMYAIQDGLSESGRILKRHHTCILHGYNVIYNLLSVHEAKTFILVSMVYASKRIELNF